MIFVLLFEIRLIWRVTTSQTKQDVVITWAYLAFSFLLNSSKALSAFLLLNQEVNQEALKKGQDRLCYYQTDFGQAAEQLEAVGNIAEHCRMHDP